MTFFLSAAWVDAWLHVYGGSLSPRFVRLEYSGALVGLCLLSKRLDKRGPIVIRQLVLNTAGEGNDSPMLEHNALLCVPRYRAAFERALADLIAKGHWDEFVLSGIRSSDLQSLVDADIASVVKETWLDTPYVDLCKLRVQDTVFLDTLSANTRAQIRRSLKLYEERGPVVLDEARTVDEACAMYAELKQLHQRAWRTRGACGAFSSARLSDFHELIIKAEFPRQAVQILRVRTGKNTIGILYNLVCDGHIAYYQSGFVFEDDNRLKPGLVCHALAIQRSLESGFREYDFLAATADGLRYKKSLSNANRRLGWIVLRRPTIRSRANLALQSLKKWIR